MPHRGRWICGLKSGIKKLYFEDYCGIILLQDSELWISVFAVMTELWTVQLKKQGNPAECPPFSGGSFEKRYFWQTKTVER